MRPGFTPGGTRDDHSKSMFCAPSSLNGWLPDGTRGRRSRNRADRRIDCADNAGLTGLHVETHHLAGHRIERINRIAYIDHSAQRGTRGRDERGKTGFGSIW